MPRSFETTENPLTETEVATGEAERGTEIFKGKEAIKWYTVSFESCAVIMVTRGVVLVGLLEGLHGDFSPRR